MPPKKKEEYTISPGVYSISEIFDLVGFDFSGITDYRRVKVGRLGFDSLDQTFRVGDNSGDILEVTLDGEVVTSALVE